MTSSQQRVLREVAWQSATCISVVHMLTMRILGRTKWVFLGLLTAVFLLLLVFHLRLDFRAGWAYLSVRSLAHTAAALTGGGVQGRVVAVFSADLSKRDEDSPRHGTALADEVQRLCRLQSNTKITKSVYNNILVDDNHKLLVCSVPKVACLNWRRVLLVLSGKVNTTNPEDIPSSSVFGEFVHLIPKLSHFNETEAQRRLRNYFKFMFVRSPFERLLSAWRDKFVTNLPYSWVFRRLYGPTIVRRYRNSSAAESQNLVGTRANEILVGFSEFLRFVADDTERGKRVDAHWERFHQLCNPCSVGYDFIGRYETLEEDALQVLKKAGVDSWVSFPRRSTTYKHQPTASLVEQFYRDVPVPLLKRLHRVFQEDFRLFEYSIPDFMDLTP